MNDNRDHIYAVINIGTSYITGMIASKLSGRVAPIAAYRIASEDCIRQGIIHNIDEATQRIDSIIDKLTHALIALHSNAKITGVYIGLDCRSMLAETYVAQVHLPAEADLVKEEHLQTLRDQVQDASYPKKEIISVAEPTYFADGKRESRPKGMHCRHLEAHYKLIMVREQILSNLRETVEERLGLQILGVIPTPLAEALATLTTEESVLGAVYVNIGGGTTSITVYHQRLLAALYVLPLGGDNITLDLMHLGLMKRDAEQLKIQSGSLDIGVDKKSFIEARAQQGGSAKRFNQREVNLYIEKRVAEILLNVVNILAEAELGDKVAKGLVLAGGVTKTTDFFESLQRRYNIELRPGELRYDICAPGTDSHYYTEYATELALIAQCAQTAVSFETLDLEEVFALTPETTAASPSEEQPEEPAEENGYSFQRQESSDSDEDEDDWEDSDEDEDDSTPQRPSEQRPKRSSHFGRSAINALSNFGSSLKRSFSNIDAGSLFKNEADDNDED